MPKSEELERPAMEKGRGPSSRPGQMYESPEVGMGMLLVDQLLEGIESLWILTPGPLEDQGKFFFYLYMMSRKDQAL